jgi:hypothetical protein
MGEIKIFSLEIKNVTVTHLTIDPASWGKRLREMTDVVRYHFGIQSRKDSIHRHGKMAKRGLYE